MFMMQRGLFIVAIFLMAGCSDLLIPKENPTPTNDFKVHPIYVIPADYQYSEDHAIRVWRGIYETQNWYQTATGGVTFELLDEENVFEVYFSDHPSEFYEDDWWGILLQELLDKGYPVQSKGTVLMLWVEGIDRLSETELALGGWSCEGDCGTAIMPISTLIAPTRLPVDMSSIFHELGHAFGLTHPVEQSDLPLSTEEEDILYSVMCQSDIRAGSSSPDHGFLTSEKAALLENPFLKLNVETNQGVSETRIINYPQLGEVPEPEISFEILPNAVVQYSTNIEDGLLYYWYFGDGSISTERNPVYAYNNVGLFNVYLMITTEQYMSARTNKYIILD